MTSAEINEIAKINLEAIFAEMYKGMDYPPIYFSDDLIALQKEIIASDPRDAQGNEPENFLYYEYYIWGLSLGLRPIEILAGQKSLADRIIEADAKGYWYQYCNGFTDFSHIIEICVEGKTGISETREIVVYQLLFDQWATLATQSM
ncbi:MAG: hypothetical protein WCT50_02900 [Patescibacteria group bacterium]|jgi:hypothetical protein